MPRRFKATLVVLIDDADQSAYHDPRSWGIFEELLTEASEFDLLRMGDHGRRGPHRCVELSGTSRFWERYGFAGPAVEAHRILAAGSARPSQRSQRLGLDMLEAIAQQEDRRDLAALRRDPQTFDYELRLLCNPLPAWLRLEAGAGDDAPASGLIDVHRTAFVTKYWTRRKHTLTPHLQQRDELEQIATIAAQRFAGEAQGQYSLTEMVDTISATSWFPALRDAGRAEEGLALLRVGGLLWQVLSGDPMVDIQVQAVTPRLEVFWGHRIARRILADADSTEDPAEELRLAWTDGEHARPLASAWPRRWRSSRWHFWGGMEPSGASPSASGCAGSAIRHCRSIRSGWPLPPRRTRRRPLWHAGSPTLPATRRQSARCSRCSGWSGRQHQELVRASPTGTCATALHSRRRVRAGRLPGPRVEAILSRPELCNDQNYVTTLLALSGIETASVAETPRPPRSGRRAAATATTWGLADQAHEILPAQHETRGASEFPRRPSASQQLEQSAQDQDGITAYHFWQHLVRAACQALVRRRGLGAFHDLATSNWYGANHDGVDRHVATRMRPRPTSRSAAGSASIVGPPKMPPHTRSGRCPNRR